MKKRKRFPQRAVTVRRNQPSFGALLVLVFLSGFAALVYEVLWFRQLGLIFGNTVHAAATVMAAFMVGLAWGAEVARRRVLRTTNPVRWFGMLEAGIGVYALAVPAVFSVINFGFVAVARHVADATPWLTALRFAFAVLALLVPTMLMGASLPVLSEAVLRSREHFTTRLGWLYGSNTAGATLGVLACGFFLLPTLGIQVTNILAGAINLVVAVVAVRLSGAIARIPSPTAVAPQAARPIALLGVAAFCGFLALALETIWFRALVLIFGSTSHSFSTMVAVFLFGMAVGAAAMGRYAGQPRRATWALAVALAGICLWTFLSVRLYDAAPEFLLGLLGRFDFSWRGMLFARVLLAAAFLVPLAVFSGLAFPAVVRLVRDHAASAGRAVSAVFSVNALGSATGAAVAGFALLPAFGLEKSLLVLGCAAGLISMAVAWRASGESGRNRLAFMAVVLVAAAGLRWRAPRWDPLLLSSGAYFSPRSHVENGEVVLRDNLSYAELLFYREGATATISVTRTQDGELRFSSDGKVEANSGPKDMMLQRMQAHLPMLFHPHPRRVLNIGLGAGVTAGAIAIYPEAKLDIVEIEPAVTNAAALFAPWNHDLIRRGRHHLIINDGRNHLLATTHRYDVITSDPFEPVVAGAASLYTLDHFRLARSRLAPGGVMAQFLPLYELSRSDLLLILRTFVRAFPRASVFFTGTDTVLLGLTDDATLRLETVAAKFAVPDVRASLAESGLDRPERLLEMLILEIEPGGIAIEDGPVKTADLPVVEFSAPQSALVYRPDANHRVLLGMFHDIPTRHLAGLTPELAAATQRGHSGLRTLLQAGLARSAGDGNGALRLLREASELAPGNPVIRNELADVLLRLGQQAQTGARAPEAVNWYRGVLRLNPRNFWALHNLTSMAMDARQTAVAQEYLKLGLEDYPESALFRVLRARHAASTGDLTTACRDLGNAVQALPRRAELWESYANCLERIGRMEDARAATKRAGQARRWLGLSESHDTTEQQPTR
jgi:spermidine synthase